MATALASLLLAHPVDGLGDEFALTQVAMQQHAWSPVDDVIIQGTAPGGERTLRVACRRRPQIGKSDASTVALFADFLRVVLQHPERLEEGRLRLGLAVSAPFGPASDVATLTEVARRQPDQRAFAQAMGAERAYSAKVRTRLKNVKEVVEAALAQSGDQTASVDDLTWQLLRGLFVIPLQLEGDVAPGRTSLIARLQTLTGSPARAEDLRRRLVEIASQGTLRAAAMTRAMLRAQLRPFGALDSAPDFSSARSQVTLLEAELRARTPRAVPVPGTGTTFAVDRSALKMLVVEAIVSAPPGGVVILHGEPDVGKSVIALAAADSIKDAGGAALAVSLRDLPSAALDLRTVLGMSPGELFAAAPSAPTTVLILDGAEVVQERDAGAVGALLTAATDAGHTAVLVVRDDALEAVTDLVRARGLAKATRLSVTSLSRSEVATLLTAVPELARLASDSRAHWLLARIGLVELLLKTADRGNRLPDTLSAEAEIFATVWRSLVRQDEKVVGDVGPDDRETALMDVARQLVTGASPATAQTGRALASLRSDGVLLSRSRSTAWEAGDRFSSDVLRDFATARLLLRDGLNVLLSSPAPRWAVRATRLAAQARLARSLGSGGSPAQEWADIQADYAALAAKDGARWSELPWEALLTAGWAPQALRDLSSVFVQDSDTRHHGIRTIMLRFSRAGACDAAVGAPFVAWLVDTPGMLSRTRSYREDPALELTVAWLRGVARLDVAGDDISEFRGLRMRVRDAFMSSEIERSDKERLEGLALLGQDHSDATVSALRGIASDAPGFLAPVVESFEAATTLAHYNAQLLVALAEAYYMERPANHPLWSSMHDDGIRGHQPSGLHGPQAAWYLGPFIALLRQSPRRGLQLINRMLDHGAKARLGTLRSLDIRAERAPTSRFEGLDIDVVELGMRRFIGDSHAWAWYRGSSVGPYPCMSALLALEVALDELVKQGVTLKELARAVLKEATTIAELGVVFGFFVRHLEDVSDELDAFLAHPDIWELEFTRVASEGHLHVQGKDAPGLRNVDRRRWTPVNTVARLVLLARERNDAQALDRFRAVGRRLLEAAGGETADAHVQQWAAHLNIDRYKFHVEGNRLSVNVDVPDAVANELRASQQRTANMGELFRLLNRYRSQSNPPYLPRLAPLPTASELEADYQLARRLENEFAADAQSHDRLLRALGGVAAAIVHAASNGANVPDEQAGWAVQLLIESAVHLGSRQIAYELSFSPDGADRQAALALPLIFVALEDESEAGDSADGAVAVIRDALCAGAGSPSVEVRHYAAEGLRILSGLACHRLPDGRCRHEVLWAAIEAAARTTILGEYIDGARQIEPIVGDIAAALAGSPNDELMLSHIAPAAIAAVDAAQSATCISDRAKELRDVLLRGVARAACHWAEHHYEWRNEYQAAFASAVLRWSTADPEAVVRVARALTSSPDALGDYLHSLMIVATHEPEVVPHLAQVWSQLMPMGLDTIANAPHRRRPRHAEKLIRSLVPSPSTLAHVENIGDILHAASTRWFPVDAVADHIEQWLNYGRGEMFAVDALVGFLRAQPIAVQVDPGLSWIHRLVVDDDGTALTCGFLLVSWLTALRDARVANVMAVLSYRAIVDALVLGNYQGARALQERDE
ncbi:MAG TPA: hypothetical protein VGD94_05195 [Vicinamibacterales bacterium]